MVWSEPSEKLRTGHWLLPAEDSSLAVDARWKKPGGSLTLSARMEGEAWQAAVRGEVGGGR